MTSYDLWKTRAPETDERPEADEEREAFEANAHVADLEHVTERAAAAPSIDDIEF